VPIIKKQPVASEAVCGFYGGGVVCREGTPRFLPLSLIDARLHLGLGPEEFPAILQTGERVLSQPRSRLQPAGSVCLEFLAGFSGHVVPGSRDRSMRRCQIKDKGEGELTVDRL
jgi:hypothetical protein